MKMIRLNRRMNHLKARLTLLCLPGLLLSPAIALADRNDESKDRGSELDMATVSIESAAARKLLRMESIKVRKRNTDYMPEGEIAIIGVKVPSDEEIQIAFKRLGLMRAGKEISKDEITSMGNIYSANSGSSSYWISRSSGAYKFTDAANTMGVKSEIGDFKRAVQIALDYVGRHSLIAPAEGETADILFVSAVKNVLATVKEKEAKDETGKSADINPTQEFTSDYYVGFGRRFKSVPVWGSRLVIRVDGTGKVASVFKNWRDFSGYGAEIAINDSNSLEDKIILDPAFSRRYEQKDISAKDLHVIDKRCGYIEAPVNYQQKELRPGCITTFRVGEKREELYPQILVSLEDGVTSEQLFGIKASEKKGTK